MAPIPFRTKSNLIIYAVGEFETYVTLEELKAVTGDSRVTYKILDSHQFIPNPGCSLPFRDFVEGCYYKRLEMKKKKDQLERALKVVLNSIYGKTAQRVSKQIGNIFNPVIASYITGYTRAQLYHFVGENGLEREVVAFATDSIATRREIAGLDCSFPLPDYNTCRFWNYPASLSSTKIRQVTRLLRKVDRSGT